MVSLARRFSSWMRWPLNVLARLSRSRSWPPGRHTSTVKQDTKNGCGVSAGQEVPDFPCLGGISIGSSSTLHGEYLSGGSSGIIEFMASGDVRKLPWPGYSEADCRRDIAVEAQIYEKLGPHPRLVKIVNWDPTECFLTMEYMINGCLKDFLREHNHEISVAQRFRWVTQAAEGLQLLHSADVVHCDVEPRNFLLDADLSLKIADFAGSSLEGSRPSACVATRFCSPTWDWRGPPKMEDDIYSLGSLIYTIMTGNAPFQELPSHMVQERYKAHEFPDVTGMPLGRLIKRCWSGEISSAQEVVNFMRFMEMAQLCKIDIPLHFFLSILTRLANQSLSKSLLSAAKALIADPLISLNSKQLRKVKTPFFELSKREHPFQVDEVRARKTLGVVLLLMTLTWDKDGFLSKVDFSFGSLQFSCASWAF